MEQSTKQTFEAYADDYLAPQITRSVFPEHQKSVITALEFGVRIGVIKKNISEQVCKRNLDEFASISLRQEFDDKFTKFVFGATGTNNASVRTTVFFKEDSVVYRLTGSATNLLVTRIHVFVLKARLFCFFSTYRDFYAGFRMS